MALSAPAYQACPNHPDVVSGLVACARCGVAYCGDCVVELEGRPYDASCKEEQVRDLRSGTAAPAVARPGSARYWARSRGRTRASPKARTPR